MNIAKMLEGKNVDFEMIPHRDTYEAQRMAEELHVSGREVAKTVLLRVEGGKDYVVAVLPANMVVDLDRASGVLGGSKTELATEDELAQQCPDCETGALPPFGSRYGMRTIVEESLSEDDSIYFEGNTHHESIRMKFDDFLEIEEPQMKKFAK
jgi:Ala-tRNA(Pro) deacylase